MIRALRTPLDHVGSWPHTALFEEEDGYQPISIIVGESSWTRPRGFPMLQLPLVEVL